MPTCTTPHPLFAALTASNRPAAPLQFAHYRVLDREDGTPWRLGAGAMGVTYRASDDRLDLPVALKVIAPSRVSDPAARAQFVREARAAARIRHTNVASVLALDDTTAQPFYTMELVEGVTLEQFLDERGTLPLPLALDLGAQIARGLEAIHREGLVHRDLKPANIMLLPLPDGGEREWLVKIIDFGVVCRSGEHEADGCGGAPMYASPEECRGCSALDARADLYALGCILWECLTGRPPFQAATAEELRRQHVAAVPRRSDLASFPAGVRELLCALLAKNPAQRPGRAAAVARQWESAALDQSPAAAPRLAGSRLALLILLLVHTLLATGIVRLLGAAEEGLHDLPRTAQLRPLPLPSHPTP